MRFLKIVLLVVCVFTAVNVHAQSSTELKRQRERINDELQQLNRELQNVQNNKKVTLKQLNLLKRKISAREEKIKIINSEVRNLDNQISENTTTVHNLQNQLDQLKKEYAGMVLFAYHNQSAYNKLMFIFAAKDFNQAYKRLKYLQQFATYRERQAGYIEGTQNELNGKIVQLGKTKEEKHTLLVDQQKEKEKLGKERSSELKTVEKLTRDAGLLQKQQKEAQARLAKVNRAVNDAIRREIEEERRKAEEKERLAAAARAKAGVKEPTESKPVAKRTTSEILNATPEAAKLSSDFLSNKGQLPWPVANGEVIHGFGAYFIEGIRMDNNGLDIKTNPGAAVRAVFAGEVTNVFDMSGTYAVVIKHGEYFTSYSNLRSISVSKGQKVSTKQSVGVAAVDEITGDPSINFTLTKGNTSVNPRLWLADK
ncbi:MAG: peptidase M23 [Sphingobacteriaceae bacterium]|nr:MAG: peptidase M23 [Sphingobacteriaceae bacterium]